MTDLKFKIGEQVMLLSGGPFMTVERVTNGIVSCVWFVANDVRREGFGEALLELRSSVEDRRRRETAEARNRANAVARDRYL